MVGHGFFLRGGALVGVSTPFLLLVGSGPDGPDGGAVLDLAADLVAGWAGGGLTFTLFLTPTWSAGKLSRGSPSVEISASSLTFGVGLGLIFY
jgi:hypothetical protein